MTTRIAVHVQPGARVRGAAGVRADGVLRLKVREKATDGRANRAVVELLAELLGVKPGDVTIVRGPASRDKLVEVQGLDRDTVRSRLGAVARKE